MQSVSARCMDGHYYLPADNPCCPLDGWSGPAAEAALEVLGQIRGRLSSAARGASSIPRPHATAHPYIPGEAGQPADVIVGRLLKRLRRRAMLASRRRSVANGNQNCGVR